MCADCTALPHQAHSSRYATCLGQASEYLATCIAEAKPAEKVPERRLWLTGSVESSPGVCGLYRTARTEPMGDRLRLLYTGDTRLMPGRGKPQDQIGTLAISPWPSRARWRLMCFRLEMEAVSAEVACLAMDCLLPPCIAHLITLMVLYSPHRLHDAVSCQPLLITSDILMQWWSRC